MRSNAFIQALATECTKALLGSEDSLTTKFWNHFNTHDIVTDAEDFDESEVVEAMSNVEVSAKAILADFD